MESQINVRQSMLEKMKRPFKNNRRLNRYWNSVQLNLTRNSGYYALVSSLMCLCLIGLRSNTEFHDHDEIDSELHYSFHSWEPKKPMEIRPRERRAVDPSDGETKIILFWTKYHGSASFDFGLGSRPFESAGCRVSNCKTTTDRLLLNESHAVIFHSGNLNISDMPPVRFDHQRWIFYSFTSPVNLAPIPKFLKDKFNWTMTYRRDSDIIHRYPFGALVASKTIRKSYGKTRPTANSVQRRIPHKKKLVAWITSTCPTSVRRENYVRQLAKHISVDIYGGCGHKYCGSHEQCMKMLREDYKFVLAFENSLCTDYVSDKLYTALENGVVPVVYGEADYRAYAPSNSYVNARDFGSPRELAEYLWLLHQNDHLYQNYFAWNQDYIVDRFPTDGWCNLCQMLHKPMESQAYSDVQRWWAEEVTCMSNYQFSLNVSNSIEPVMHN
ncbi:4-galactosyl-N-acetylglucosaminide 3-alpha-L-fucosyltransferase 9 [Daphnia magna]|uniref:4-galactosyl-N-acetylglucosaminide 3-alpha-L-fucosyltransferase 9 n=1 Tax=Daphnia magna TaxID=35525 RepID=UPI001E1BBF80|nr:4-galactosyl-N-acetylglucosaminide 3-alpha-L-fucosyltransferase 9 [Daphnia magna]XP_045032282.1 4-galactosyl-N-acetylglucosaminide 3-alpha-L-fucosyltransferase 9 [Daphnia magna]